MLTALVLSLNRTSFRTHVLSLRDGGCYTGVLSDKGVSVRSLKASSASDFVRSTRVIMSYVRDLRPDIIQGWMYHGNLAATFARRFCRTSRLIWGIRCSRMDRRRYGWKSAAGIAMSRYLAKVPDAIVPNSEAGRRYHERIGYHARRWVTIQNGIDTELFSLQGARRDHAVDALGVNPSHRIVGMVARLDPMKDHATFLRAAALVVACHRDVSFVCVGGGDSRYASILSAEAANMGLAGRCFWTGETSDITKAYAAFDVHCLSSYGEGFPNVVGEAMSCGVPCVVTDVGDAADIVGGTGVVVPPKDPAALAAGIEQLLNMTAEERQRLGQAARERVVEHFSLEKMVQQYELLYDEVLSH